MTRLLALLLLALLASPAAAAMPAVEPPFASGYVTRFLDFWANWIKNRNAVLFTVLVVGAIAIFIITRGKKLK